MCTCFLLRGTWSSSWEEEWGPRLALHPSQALTEPRDPGSSPGLGVLVCPGRRQQGLTGAFSFSQSVGSHHPYGCEQRGNLAFAPIYLRLSHNNCLALWVSVSPFLLLLLVFE